jgi:hypothetical protein
MGDIEKKETIEWVLEKLYLYGLMKSRLVHTKTIVKSNYDSYRKEEVILKDLIKKSETDCVNNFIKDFEDFQSRFEP